MRGATIRDQHLETERGKADDTGVDTGSQDATNLPQMPRNTPSPKEILLNKPSLNRQWPCGCVSIASDEIRREELQAECDFCIKLNKALRQGTRMEKGRRDWWSDEEDGDAEDGIAVHNEEPGSRDMRRTSMILDQELEAFFAGIEFRSEAFDDLGTQHVWDGDTASISTLSLPSAESQSPRGYLEVYTTKNPDKGLQSLSSVSSISPLSLPNVESSDSTAVNIRMAWPMMQSSTLDRELGSTK